MPSGMKTIKNSDDLKELIISHLGEGRDLAQSKSFILEEYNTTEADIDNIAQQAEQEFLELYKNSQPDSRTIYMGLLGGVLGALFSALIWVVIVALTDYEIGVMAFGVGILVGYSVLLFAGKKRSRGLQVIAAAFSALSVFGAQYLIFYYYFNQLVLEGDSGLGVLFNFKWLSVDLFMTFINSLTEIVDGYTLLFMVLAVLYAWSVPRPFKLKNKIS